MKHCKRKIWAALTLVLLAAVVATLASFKNPDVKQLREGDIVFQMSKSRQSKYIQLATASPWSHCGIVVMRGGKAYVLEASATVRLTPIDKWIAQGRFGRFTSRRVLSRPLKVRCEGYLGLPYDTAFKFGNGKWYCSELVYDIYLRQFGVQLCKPRPVSSYHILNLGNLMKKRGIDPSQLVVAPSDLL